jgi:hypothetical protein
VAIGTRAGNFTQGWNSISIGTDCGYSGQGTNAVAIGNKAGYTNQGQSASALGDGAGYNNQGASAVAVGVSSGSVNQGPYSVAIGRGSGSTGQGQYSVAIGFQAGYTNQPPNSIIINASGTTLNPSIQSAFYVNPIRSVSAQNTLLYDTNTKEIVYQQNQSGSYAITLTQTRGPPATISDLASQFNTYTIDFSPAFTTTPSNVMVSLNYSNTTISDYINMFLYTYNLTASSFKCVVVYNFYNNVTDAPFTINWRAFQ